MRKTTLLLVTGILFTMMSKAQVRDFNAYPVYEGKDLGLTYARNLSTFVIWSPPAEEVELILYATAEAKEPLERLSMLRSVQGTWRTVVKGDQSGKFYVFRVRIGDKWSNEVPDPYAKVVGVNGRRALVADPDRSAPDGWATDKAPGNGHPTRGNPVDAVVYELHVRDASIHSSSGIKNKGKYIGLTETGTRNSAGLSTGLDHIRDLGVTHVHLLPVFDYNSVDESRPDSAQYNWGYDPLNYNTPEGSYATNAKDGVTRIRELKQLVAAMHHQGVRVVMDVVYNHTMFGETSSFNQLVPGYYYRQDAKGGFSNATACGNETASERPMVRKFILESVMYWMKEFHVDGFRFDLMGVHDIATMNLISGELRKLRPDMLLYGEGWTAGSCPLPDTIRALKGNASKLDAVAVFSDDIRDGIKGSVFEHADKGFVSGKPGMEQSIRFGIVASTLHDQVDYSKVNYSKAPYANDPGSTMTYCECHDNHVLWDKLAVSAPEATEMQRKEMHRLALLTVLTSQGISFLHAGTEFLRSKGGVENSFNAGDRVNAIDWDLKTMHQDVYAFVKALVHMRRGHPAFRMTTADAIRKNLHFLDAPGGVVAYTINGAAAGDSWKKILVVLNGSDADQSVIIPAGGWMSFISGNRLQTSNAEGKVVLPPHTGSVYHE
jgi:pullulanase